ncbi:unnamed protein product [Clavelina lepadiformis]|uniref:Sushi domain-containing protein n=1 Tax=Clavelina lepadiformis TaxID=159417 RepID=A0ABP0G0X6_CLALP
MTFLMVTCDENQGNQLFSSSYQYQVMTYNGLFLSVGHRTSRKPIFLDQIHPFYGNADWKFKDVENGMLYSLFGARNNGSCLKFNSTENMDVVPSTCTAEAQVDGTVCSVSCNAGFSLSSTSSSSVQCVRGSWNITSHLKCLPDNGCNPYESTLLKDVTVTPQTCVSESMDEKSVCSFSCGDPLKYLHGVSSVTCKDDGSWSSSTSVACNAYCSTTDLSLAINKSTTYMEGCSSTLIKSGGVCSFQCLSGYILNGTPLVTCLNSGNWDSTPPMCEKRCRPPVLGPLATLSNCTTQKLQNGYTVGTTCSVTCPAGYVAPFGSFIQCQNSGLWNSGGLSKCVVSCPAFLPSTDFHATPSSCSESPSPIGTNCQLTCTSGYLFNGRDFVSSFERTCGSNGLWQGTVAQCVTACPPISTVIDSNLFNYEPLSCMSGPQLVGARCSKKCRNMDNILGKISELTCTSNGTWLTSEVYSTLDDCVSYCPGLIASIHVQIEPASCTNEMVEPGTECFIHCPFGMDRIGPGIKNCNSVVDWGIGSSWSSAMETECVARCPPVLVPPYTYVFPTDCSYSCIEFISYVKVTVDSA